MAVPIWPVELPQRPLRNGFNRGIGDGRLLSPMSQGPQKGRRRFTAVPDPFSPTMEITTDQWFRLDRFWREDTKGGVLPFRLIDPMLHEQPLLAAPDVKLLTEDGLPILISAWLLVTFGGNPLQANAMAGKFYRVAFNLFVMP